MRLHYAVILVATVVLIADVVSSDTIPSANNDVDEERTGGFSVTLSETTVAKLRGWLNSRISVDDVFTYLKLPLAGDKLLDNPKFFTWLRYADDFDKTNSQKAVTATLVAHYSDEALFKMIEAAKKVPNAETFAIKFQAEKFQGWLNTKQSPNDVFKLLGLDKAQDATLVNPLFGTWLSYFKIFNKENPSDKAKLLYSLVIYQGDNGVGKMIDEAMKHPSTVKIAKMVQTERLKDWLRAERVSPDSAFYVLIFTKVKMGENFLTHPDFNLWTKYLNDFNNKYPPDKRTNVIDSTLSIKKKIWQRYFRQRKQTQRLRNLPQTCKTRYSTSGRATESPRQKWPSS